MFNKNITELGVNLSEIITSKNIRLVPKKSTLMLELCNAVSNNLAVSYQPSTKQNIVYDLTKNSSGTVTSTKTGTMYSQSTHDSIMDNYIEDLSKLVNAHISFTRTVVNKEVLRLKEKVIENLNLYKYKEPEDLFNVTYYSFPDIFKSGIISSEISSYGQAKIAYPNQSLPLTGLNNTDFDLLKYIMTGDDDEDKYIISWYESVGGSKLLGHVLGNVPAYSLGTVALLDYLLINYLFYRNLKEKEEIIVGGISLNFGLSVLNLRTTVAGTRDYFGASLFSAIATYHKDIRNGRLLTTDSNTSFTYLSDKVIDITIYEENFKKLSETGVGIDSIFGSIASEGKNSITVNEVIANSAEYLVKWKNIRSLYVIFSNNTRLDVFKQILSRSYDEAVKTSTDEESKQFTTDTTYNATTIKLVNTYISDLQVSDIDELDTICLILVAKYRFRFSNAYYILREMSEILNMSDKIEPMEAALFATVKYITDFLLEQINVVKV